MFFYRSGKTKEKFPALEEKLIFLIRTKKWDMAWFLLLFICQDQNDILLGEEPTGYKLHILEK